MDARGDVEVGEVHLRDEVGHLVLVIAVTGVEIVGIMHMTVVEAEGVEVAVAAEAAVAQGREIADHVTESRVLTLVLTVAAARGLLAVDPEPEVTANSLFGRPWI